MARPSALHTPPPELVLSALRESGKPLTAYGILEKLKSTGIKSPPIIYRALDALVKRGAVHKVNALNAFVACDCAPGHDHALSVLTVCDRCRRVEELHSPAVMDYLTGLCALRVRLPPGAVVELPVVCTACA